VESEGIGFHDDEKSSYTTLTVPNSPHFPYPQSVINTPIPTSRHNPLFDFVEGDFSSTPAFVPTFLPPTLVDDGDPTFTPTPLFGSPLYSYKSPSVSVNEEDTPPPSSYAPSTMQEDPPSPSSHAYSTQGNPPSPPSSTTTNVTQDASTSAASLHPHMMSSKRHALIHNSGTITVQIIDRAVPHINGPNTMSDTRGVVYAYDQMPMGHAPPPRRRAPMLMHKPVRKQTKKPTKPKKKTYKRKKQ
jgi:hypothetical protein